MKSPKQNYSNFSQFKSVILGSLKKRNIKIEKDVLKCEDENSNEYAYIHLKDRSGGVEDAVECVLDVLEKHTKCVIRHDSHKVLIWVPKERKIKYIVQDGGKTLFEVKE